MAESQAGLGYGASFSTGDSASPTVYTEVAEIATINFNGFSVAEVDTTHLKSPNATMESIPGLLKPGTIDLTGNYTGDDSQQVFTTLSQNRTIFPLKITSTLGTGDTYTLTGKGFVAKLQKGPFDAQKKIDFAVSIQMAGAFTEIIASS